MNKFKSALRLYGQTLPLEKRAELLKYDTRLFCLIKTALPKEERLQYHQDTLKEANDIISVNPELHIGSSQTMGLQEGRDGNSNYDMIAPFELTGAQLFILMLIAFVAGSLFTIIFALPL